MMRPRRKPAYATQTANPSRSGSRRRYSHAGAGAAPQLRWQASARPTAPARPSRQSPPSIAGSGGFLVQAGSFRSEDNAEKARSLLGGIAPVEVAPFAGRGRDYVPRSCRAFRGQEICGKCSARQGDRGGI